MRRTPPLCLLRTTSFKARYPPGHLPWPVLSTNFAPVGGQAQTTPEDADRSVTPAEGPWQGIATHPGTEPQTFALSKLTLTPTICSYSATAFFVQAAGHKDGDIIGERGNPCCMRASKRDTTQGWICPLITKPSELGLQSEDMEKR